MPIHAHWRPLSLHYLENLMWVTDWQTDRLTDWQTVTVTVTLTELYCFIVSTYLRATAYRHRPCRCQLSLLTRSLRPLTPTVTSLPWKFNVSDRLTDWQTDRLTDCDSHSDTNRVVLFHCINLFKGYRLCGRPICLLWAVVSWQLTRLLAGWPGLDSTGVYCIVLYCIVLYCIVGASLEWNGK